VTERAVKSQPGHLYKYEGRTIGSIEPTGPPGPHGHVLQLHTIHDRADAERIIASLQAGRVPAPSRPSLNPT
jgi:hypothetical protein